MRKKRFILFMILFVFTFSAYFIVNSFAAYKGEIISSGSTDIAKWEVLTLNTGEPTIDLSPGGSAASYLLRITSTSHVVAGYDITISNLPDSVRVSLDNGSYVTPVNNTVTFSDVDHIDATDNTVKEHTISFRATNDSTAVSNREISIDVKFVQDEI